MGGLRLSNLVAVLLLAGGCDDPYAGETPTQATGTGSAPAASSSDGSTDAGADGSTGGDVGSTGGAEDPSTTTGPAPGSTGADDEGSTWPAASMDDGGEPDSTSTGDEGPTCTELECPVDDLAGCTGDCNSCDLWSVSWLPVPSVSVYLVRAKIIVLNDDGPMLPGDPPAEPDPNADPIYKLQDSVFRITADGAPSTFQWTETDGRITFPCDFITGGCGVYAVAEVEVVGCVGGVEGFPLSAHCGGAPLGLGGKSSMLPSNAIPTGACDPNADADTSSTG